MEDEQKGAASAIDAPFLAPGAMFGQTQLQVGDGAGARAGAGPRNGTGAARSGDVPAGRSQN